MKVCRSPFREVQGFVHFIREERVFLDSASEVGAANQVGMKAQRIALRLERFARIFYADHLSGCQTDHRAFLVIVSLAAVNQVAVLFVFQKNHVKAECMPHVVHRFGL